MNGALQMSSPATSTAIRSAISSPVSVVGRSRSDWRCGRTLDLFGRDHAPASPSAPPASAKASTIPATSGPSSSASSRSDALQSSLESRLRLRLRGSDLCEVIWKPWITPWGQSLSRPRARVRTTLGTDTGSWPTPAASEARLGYQHRHAGAKGTQKSLTTVAVETLWPTPTSLAPAKDGNNEAGNSAGLVAIRKHALATYPTPEAGVYGTRDVQKLLDRRARVKEATGNGNGFGLTLGQFAMVDSIGSSEPTEKRGALNPAFVCWLMGFPPEWVSCGVSAMRSIPARPRRSSPPIAT